MGVMGGPGDIALIHACTAHFNFLLLGHCDGENQQESTVEGVVW